MVDIFDLAQSETPANSQPDKKANKPSVKVTEKAVHLRTLFSIIYPIDYEIPESSSLMELFELLKVAEKYEFKVAISRLISLLAAKARQDKKN